MSDNSINLPKKNGEWHQADAVQQIDSSNIFEYMNGAGELYLGYRFNDLEVFEYTAENQPRIIVEVYRMQTSDDAFGLLSLDWGGEVISFEANNKTSGENYIALASRALYGRGLLRIASGKIYARIMARRETPESRGAVIRLGAAIAKSTITDIEPQILQYLPNLQNTNWQVRRERISFFRSHLALNSIFYLSHQNILKFNHSSDAVTTQLELKNESGENERAQFLLIKYADAQEAREALSNFYKIYLPEKLENLPDSAEIQKGNYYQLEDGWFGHKQQDRYIVFIFTAPTEDAAKLIINRVQFKNITRGKHHE